MRRWIDWCIGSYKQNGFGLWALELKETGSFIGDCGISMQNIDGEILPEIGYHVNKKYWRQGYAKEACAVVKDWLFQNTDFDSVYSYMNQENVASCATAAANGMTKIKAYPKKKSCTCTELHAKSGKNRGMRKRIIDWKYETVK